MQNLTPVARAARAPLPDFAPVPRKFRHDGWTPERQRAFVEALADTGSVTRAAGMVNMAQTNCYALRRAPGAEEFRRAWDAALDMGVARLKDVAFERAVEGTLEPVIAGGRMIGYRRKHNDALLMFCLRHYGRDAEGKRTTINYFRASASASAGGGAAGAQAAATTTVRTIAADPPDVAAAAAREAAGVETLAGFAGVTLDAEAEAAIALALEGCAARAREADAAIDAGGEAGLDAALADADAAFVPVAEEVIPYGGAFLPPTLIEDCAPLPAGEAPWRLAGAVLPDWATAAPVPEPSDAGVAAVKRRAPRRRGRAADA